VRTDYNTIGQALLARRMGKNVSSPKPAQASTAWPRLPLLLVMAWNVWSTWAQRTFSARLQRLPYEATRRDRGAGVVRLETLKDALNEAMRDWVTNVESTFYILGTAAGPHPYPMLVRDFQCVIGREAIVQMQEQAGRQPDCVLAASWWSNAIGIFYPYLAHPGVKLIGLKRAVPALLRQTRRAVSAGSPASCMVSAAI